MYGITQQDIQVIDTKIDLQRKYMLNRFFDFGDESKSILDFTYSANLNPKKYFAEMNNRIKSIFDYAKDLDLKPVFITLTAPSKYHKKDREKFGSNKKAIDFKYTWYNSAGGAVAYIMKYVTKTFKNEDDKNTQYASYWYIKHNVRRFLCSRTLAPITMYRKIRHFFKKYDNDYLKVTKLIQNNEIRRLFDDTSYYYMMYNPETDEVESVNIWQKNTDLILNSRIGKNDGIAEDLIQKRFNFNNRKEKKKPLLAIVSDFEKYAFSENLEKFILLPVVPSKLSDYQLSQYFRILDKEDIATLDLVHFGVVKNEMIKRRMITNEIALNLNEYVEALPMTNQRAVAHVPLTFVVADEICYDVSFI